MCKELNGKYDFRNFCILGSRHNANTERVIHKLSLNTQKEQFISQPLHYLEIEANGFFKYMIRIFFEYIFKVSAGEITRQQFMDYLKNNRQLSRKDKLPPNGLYLYQININEAQLLTPSKFDNISMPEDH